MYNARSQAYTVDGLTPTPAAIRVTDSLTRDPQQRRRPLDDPQFTALNTRLNAASSALQVAVVIRMLTVGIVGSWRFASSRLPTMPINFPERFLKGVL